MHKLSKQLLPLNYSMDTTEEFVCTKEDSNKGKGESVIKELINLIQKCYIYLPVYILIL